MDGTTLKLELIGLHERINIVDITRERVEYNKQRKGIYEIVNKREQPTSPLEGMSSAETIALREITNHYNSGTPIQHSLACHGKGTGCHYQSIGICSVGRG